MENSFTFEMPVDRMSHQAEILSSTVAISTFNHTGVPDKRFKTGYRVLPYIGINYSIEFFVLRNDVYKMNQIWQIGKPKTMDDFGVYMVTGIILDAVKLIPVSTKQNKNHSLLTIKNKMQFMYYGATVGEGSI